MKINSVIVKMQIEVCIVLCVVILGVVVNMIYYLKILFMTVCLNQTLFLQNVQSQECGARPTVVRHQHF